MLITAVSHAKFIGDLAARPPEVPFPSYAVNLLQKHFAFPMVSFFASGAGERTAFLPEEVREKAAGPRHHKEIMLATVSDPEVPNAREQYNEYFFALDGMTYAKLPDEDRERSVLGNGGANRSPVEYIEYLHKRELYHFLCLYLRDSADRYLGRVAVSRSRDKGAFSQAEADALASLEGPLSGQYEKYLGEYRSGKRLAMMEFSLANLPVGVVFLDPQLQVLYKNDAADKYCADIMTDRENGNNPSFVWESGKPDIQHVLNRIMHSGAAGANAPDVIHTAAGRYGFKLLPYVTNGLDALREVNYVAYIICQPEGTGKNKKMPPAMEMAAKHRLTPRETELLQLIETGCTAAEIGKRLCISHHTVKAHINSIYRKVNVSNRAALLHRMQNGYSMTG